MGQLTVEGFVAEAHEGRAALVSRLRRDVNLAEDGAIATHAAWVFEIGSLSRDEESEIALHAMHGDYCETGRVLCIALRRRVLETAKDQAEDHIYRQYNIALEDEPGAHA